jgi:dihydroorotate dehydrogenase
MPGFYDLFRPLIFKADPETAHQLTLKALKSGLLPPCAAIQDPSARGQTLGPEIPEPGRFIGGLR